MLLSRCHAAFTAVNTHLLWTPADRAFPLWIMDRRNVHRAPFLPKDLKTEGGDFIFSNGVVTGGLGEKKMVSEKGKGIAKSNGRNIITKYFVYT